MDMKETIRTIREALQRRSGKQWSVTHGRGTAYGWLTIDAPPSRRTWGHRLKAGAVTNSPEDYEAYDTGKPGGYTSPEDRAELAQLLGVACSCQGVSVPSSNNHYREYIARAQGERDVTPTPAYWD